MQDSLIIGFRTKSYLQMNNITDGYNLKPLNCLKIRNTECVNSYK